jgi:uncharacterized protein
MSIPIFSLLTVFFLADTWVWWRLNLKLRRVRNASFWQTYWAWVALPPAIFTGLTILLFHPMARIHRDIPAWIGAYFYLWNFLLMPPMFLLLMADLLAQSGVRLIRGIKARLERTPSPVPIPEPAPQALFSRRHFLTAAAVSVPPLLSFSMAEIALTQRGKFRIRPFDLAVPGWPQELDGFTIAHVADIHTGMFTTPKMLNDIANATNNLRADLILLGGDLINLSHADLHGALDMVNRLDSKSGIFMVQGNHDVVESAAEFDATCRRRGVRLLVDQVETLNIDHVPIQLLGTRWTPKEPDMAISVATVASMREPTIFPILLTHHPHNWDEARNRNLPLVLAGHTHGGQIMLTKNIGGGPLRFKYWTGLYEKDGSQLLVSNGVGNWFPLRINAPAEILHITLHPGPSDSVAPPAPSFI